MLPAEAIPDGAVRAEAVSCGGAVAVSFVDTPEFEGLDSPPGRGETITIGAQGTPNDALSLGVETFVTRLLAGLAPRRDSERAGGHVEGACAHPGPRTARPHR